MSATLFEQIQQFYDSSSALWERVWGEHMHHGYYGENGDRPLERRQAQIETIEQLLAWGGEIPSNGRWLDVGCGIGGSTLYLAQKFAIDAVGITLSPYQAKRAGERAQAAQLGDRVQFQVANALEMPFPDASFDLVWSLESGEHMPHKRKFLQECDRVLKPGGVLLMATWCHRPVAPPHPPLTAREHQHLSQIYRVYRLPYVISLPQYEEIAREVGLSDLRTADWSQAVAPFWDQVIESAFDPVAIFWLLLSGPATIEGALSLDLMREGYRSGLIRFGLLRGIRPIGGGATDTRTA